mmetsp:Transcript_9247/g.27986  ORF Transcript_9247/g.27986 Transcript_9247/m.27986 type:complete len:230 (+) Transcript_9247:222-911(+)
MRGCIICAWLSVVFHSTPSGFRMLRSNCSRDLNGKGTAATVNFAAFLSRFSEMMTFRKAASLRRSAAFSSCSCRASLAVRLRCSCRLLGLTPKPDQSPQPGISVSSATPASASTRACFSLANSDISTLSGNASSTRLCWEAVGISSEAPVVKSTNDLHASASILFSIGATRLVSKRVLGRDFGFLNADVGLCRLPVRPVAPLELGATSGALPIMGIPPLVTDDGVAPVM